MNNQSITPDMIPNRDIQVTKRTENNLIVVRIGTRYTGPLDIRHDDMPSDDPRNKRWFCLAYLTCLLFIGGIVGGSIITANGFNNSNSEYIGGGIGLIVLGVACCLPYVLSCKKINDRERKLTQDLVLEAKRRVAERANVKNNGYSPKENSNMLPASHLQHNKVNQMVQIHPQVQNNLKQQLELQKPQKQEGAGVQPVTFQ